MSARVSVIMGIYNCEDTLTAAINSILAQTYRDWELILCDDGSIDGTYQVAASFQSRFPDKIILLKNPHNMGLNYTLNRCLSKATGEYIARQDGDDISLPKRFENEVNFLDTHLQYAIVSCPMVYFDENGDWAVGKITCQAPKKEMLVHGTVHCHAPCMVRASAMRSVGGYSEEMHLQRVEDWHLWVKMYSEGFKGWNLSEPLYKMRDDRNAEKRRKFYYRINEVYVITLAIKKFKMPVWNYIFVLRPILVGVLPPTIYRWLHRKNISAM